MKLYKSNFLLLCSFFVLFVFLIQANTVFASPTPENRIDTIYRQYSDLIENIKSMEQKPSIKQQIEMKVNVDDIICNEGKVLLLRWFGNSSACLTHKSADILVQRGWGIYANVDRYPGINECTLQSRVLYENINEYSNSKILSLIRDAISPDRTQWFRININLDYADFDYANSNFSFESDDFVKERFYLDIVKDRLEKDFDQVSIESYSICTN